MSLVPAVTELMLAEMLYLQYDNPTRPIFMYINSAGVQVRVLSKTVPRSSFQELAFSFGMFLIINALFPTGMLIRRSCRGGNTTEKKKNISYTCSACRSGVTTGGAARQEWIESYTTCNGSLIALRKLKDGIVTPSQRCEHPERCSLSDFALFYLTGSTTSLWLFVHVGLKK